ncbi:MAG: hypothetical protein B7Y67_15870, partial [Polynucleobacter sp. 35-46-11]
MLTLQHIELDVKALPLLSKRIEIGSVKLSGLELLLQRNSSGKANWDMSADISTATPASISSNGNTDASTVSNNLIYMDSISIVNAQIQYQDAANPISTYQIKRLSLVEGGDKTVISLGMQAQGQAIELSGKTGSLSGLFKQWDVGLTKFPLDLALNMNGKPLLIKGEIIKPPKAMPSINLAVSSKSFDWPTLDVATNPAPQTVGGTQPAPATRQAQKPQSRYVFSDETIPFDSIPRAKGKIVVDIAELGLPKRKPIENLQATLHLDGSSIDIPNISFQMGKGSANLQMNLSKTNTVNPMLMAKGVTKDFTLENLLARLDPSSKVSGGDMKLA